MSASSERGLRYRRLFERLRSRGEGAFVPFVVLGDPNAADSLEILRTMMAAGADALEVGLPFSDPVADGPVVQAAAVRALAAGGTVRDCWKIVRAVREADPQIPVGLLAYANLVLSRGSENFHREAALAGVDSVLVPDLPVLEAGYAAQAARDAGNAPVFIAPPNVDDHRLRLVARESEGYTYVTARAGVTGERSELCRKTTELLARLAAAGAPPSLLGFGISGTDQVRAALRGGAEGVISGSAIIRIVLEHSKDPKDRDAALTSYVKMMKAATRHR